MLRLLPPTMEWDAQIQNFRTEYLASGNSMDGGASLRKFPRTQDWLEHLDPEEKEYLAVREEDGRLVGLLQIRTRLNAYLEAYAGHIGYCVRPSERRKGYATRMLALAVGECERLGIGEILVCCLQENEGSRRTILRCGGEYESTCLEPDDHVPIERYWIHVPGAKID